MQVVISCCITGIWRLGQDTALAHHLAHHRSATGREAGLQQAAAFVERF